MAKRQKAKSVSIDGLEVEGFLSSTYFKLNMEAKELHNWFHTKFHRDNPYTYKAFMVEIRQKDRTGELDVTSLDPNFTVDMLISLFNDYLYHDNKPKY